MSEPTSTPISPAEVYEIIRACPSLEQAFRTECFVNKEEHSADFAVDPERVYDHDRGMTFLKRRQLPLTREALAASRQTLFQTLTQGSTRYNVGEYIVIFPEPVSSARDFENEGIWVAEVLAELEFPSEEDLVAQDQTIESALSGLVESGHIRLRKAGHRMYGSYQKFDFQDKFAAQ